MTEHVTPKEFASQLCETVARDPVHEKYMHMDQEQVLNAMITVVNTGDLPCPPSRITSFRRDVIKELVRKYQGTVGPKRRDTAIDNLLLIIDLITDKTKRFSGGGSEHQVESSFFRRMMGLSFPSLIEEVDDSLRIFSDASLDSLDGKLDYGGMSSIGLVDGNLTLDRSRQVPLSAVRGRVDRIGRSMIETAVCVLSTRTGDFVTTKQFHAVNGQQIQNVTRRGNDRGGDGGRQAASNAFDQHVRLNIGVQLTMEYYWGVELVIPDGPGFVLPCSTEGVKAILKDRDKPAGYKRRQHLRNWVGEHARMYADRDDVLIRQHLRGTRRCMWNGYDCRILPPLFQIREVEKKYGKRTPVSVQEDAEILRLGDSL